MPLYTFFPSPADGAAPSFVSRELADDAAAEAFALTVLDQHRTCAYVVAWNGDREVCALRREAAEVMGTTV